MAANCEYAAACSMTSYVMERRAEWEELAANANPNSLEAVDRDIATQDISNATIEAAKLPSPPAATARCIGCILNITEFGSQEDL